MSNLKQNLKSLVLPVCTALSLSALVALPSLIFRAVDAYTVPVTFSDGSTLTAAQLNSVNNTAANAFNGHDHSGTDGEASTLAAHSASGDITFTGATASLECDGTVAADLLLDQGDFNVFIGSGSATGTETSGEGLTIRANTGDPRLTLRANNSASNSWNMIVDNNDSDILELDYAGSKALEVTTSGGIAAGGLNANDHAIAWETYSGTLCTPGGAGCTVDVDTSAPGSGRPISMSCLAEKDNDYAYDISTIPENPLEGAYVSYEVATDDITLNIYSSIWDNTDSYSCIVFYVP